MTVTPPAPPPLPDELEQASAGMVILFVDFEVFRQILDARAEKRNLYRGRARVRCMKLVLRKQLLRPFGSYPHLSSIFLSAGWITWWLSLVKVEARQATHSLSLTPMPDRSRRRFTVDA